MIYSPQRVFTLGMLVLAAGFIATSCSKENYVQQGDTLPIAFEKSMTQFNNENYDDAIRNFELVIQIGRGTDYGRDAQYYLAESYFRNEQYLMAASEFERYASLFPRSERREEVDFKEAFCYYKLSPRFRLDQKYTRRAIEKFNLFESRYPNSGRIKEISKYEDELRNKLAHKLYNAADLYMRIDEYEAAAIYYGLTIDRYPESSPWAEMALVDQINAYVIYADNSVQSKQRERYEMAVQSYEKYLQLFPEGEHRSLAEEYVDKARVALSQLADSGQGGSSGGDTGNRR